jgi:hypothetical protein
LENTVSELVMRKPNEKIIFEVTTLLLGTMIVISSLQIPKSAYELKSEVQQNNNMIFFGFGNIKNLTVDGKNDLKGVIRGNASIDNSNKIWIPYFLLIIDKVNKKIDIKWSLPEEFVLKNFSGVGRIIYYPALHSPDWTHFKLIGTFEKIIYN